MTNKFIVLEPNIINFLGPNRLKFVLQFWKTRENFSYLNYHKKMLDIKLGRKGSRNIKTEFKHSHGKKD